MVFLCKIHRSPAGPYPEEISSDGDDRRHWGLKFSIPVTFWVGTFGKYSFCVAINLSGDF